MSEMVIQSLPVDPFHIADRLGIEIMTYSEAEELFPLMIWKLRAKQIDAIICQPDYLTDEQYILYDDSRPADRIRFTIAHEIGHFRLGHLSVLVERKYRFSYNKLSDPIEQEAEEFAGELLRPPLLLALVKIEDPPSIQDVCNVSYSAATIGSTRIQKLKQSTTKAISQLTQFYTKQFHDFIYQRRCPTCDHYFVSKHAKFCPICGGSKIIWGQKAGMTYDFAYAEGEPKEMLYDSYILDQNGKATICPRCGNEEIHPQYNICKICGTFLINMCAGKFDFDSYGNRGQVAPSCNTVAEGNQRFCYICGGITTFYKDDLLSHWVDEHRKKNGVEEEEIPF